MEFLAVVVVVDRRLYYMTALFLLCFMGLMIKRMTNPKSDYAVFGCCCLWW